MDVGLALFSGFVYWLSSCKVGYTLESSLGSGLFIGFMFGLFFRMISYLTELTNMR